MREHNFLAEQALNAGTTRSADLAGSRKPMRLATTDHIHGRTTEHVFHAGSRALRARVLHPTNVVARLRPASKTSERGQFNSAMERQLQFGVIMNIVSPPIEQ